MIPRCSYRLSNWALVVVSRGRQSHDQPPARACARNPKPTLWAMETEPIPELSWLSRLAKRRKGRGAGGVHEPEIQVVSEEGPVVGAIPRRHFPGAHRFPHTRGLPSSEARERAGARARCREADPGNGCFESLELETESPGTESPRRFGGCFRSCISTPAAVALLVRVKVKPRSVIVVTIRVADVECERGTGRE